MMSVWHLRMVRNTGVLVVVRGISIVRMRDVGPVVSRVIAGIGLLMIGCVAVICMRDVGPVVSRVIAGIGLLMIGCVAVICMRDVGPVVSRIERSAADGVVTLPSRMRVMPIVKSVMDELPSSDYSLTGNMSKGDCGG